MIGRFRDGIFDTLGRHCFLACACRQILSDHDHPCGPASPPASSSIELFFDLVFVFVITQVTQLVEHAHGAMEFLRALLVLVPTWWMYAGYAWSTNNVGVGGSCVSCSTAGKFSNEF